MHTGTTLLVTLVTLLSASVAFAAPTKLSQQGRLLDGDGAPLTGIHGLIFSLRRRGSVLRFVPPFTTTEDQMDQAADILDHAISEVL